MKNKKAAIIGAGFVGASAAYSLMLDGTADEIVLIDIDHKKACGEADAPGGRPGRETPHGI